ncbi:MAG: succinylglutamate desuccinylase/aspartoacylase family protein [Bacteroidetes bacterium]|nr:succinylglutamate desuccinylase/aspartoacylase family protein [Bacteroidota bacterium]MDA1333288.1 succinylglutamate desuccinylase/aspartoacylase family protein [Bacteroidota bacterium]
MSDMLQFNELSAAPGTTTRGWITRDITGIEVKMPVYLVNGSMPGPKLVVTAGIHGGEYPCVEAATRLGRDVDPTKLRGQMIIVPSANPVAFKARSIYITPPDGLNLNRQFPGDPNGTFTQQWADWLFQNVITAGDMYIDMHGGDMIEALVPFVAITTTDNEAANETAEKMARAYGIRAMLVKEGAGPIGGTTTASAAQAGVPALLTEAGGQGVWHEHEVDILQDGMRRVMSAFDMYEAINDPGETAQRLGGWEWLRAEVDGLFYPTVGIGDMVEKGQDMGNICDIFGEELQSSTSPVSGEILFLVTSLAMNSGDPLMAIAYE